MERHLHDADDVKVPETPAEIAARRKRAKAEREKKAKHARRTAMGPREIAAGLAAAATTTRQGHDAEVDLRVQTSTSTNNYTACSPTT